MLAVGATVVIICFSVVDNAFADYTFSNVDYPGAAWTAPTKINDAGQIVGYYCCSAGVSKGFLFSGGTYTTIECPPPYNSTSAAFGINNLGQIVGGCADGDGNAVGFLLSGGVFTFLDGTTQAWGINDSGQIVGWYPYQGFLFSGGAMTTLSVPGFGATYARAINNAGQIVGETQLVAGEGDGHGFLLANGSYSLIDNPNASTVPVNFGTIARGINDAGQIVGMYTDSTGVYHGFLLAAGVFTNVDHPNAQGTYAQGINLLGRIVGDYVDANGVDHGFVTSPPTPSYTSSIQPPIRSDGSSVYSASRGVVPVKFTLQSDGVATCALPPATIAVFRTSGGTLESINQNDYLMPPDNGSNFRIDTTNCQYVYNLGSGSLGVGTYLVQIIIDGSAVGSGTFGLK